MDTEQINNLVAETLGLIMVKGNPKDKNNKLSQDERIVLIIVDQFFYLSTHFLEMIQANIEHELNRRKLSKTSLPHR